MFYLIFIAIILVFGIVFTIRKKKARTDFDSIHLAREKENAPKILYLRAFNVDGDDEGNGNVSIMKLLPKEMEIAKDLIHLKYHLVGVGKPDENLPEIGFHRKKFSHDVWQEEVLKLMKESHLVIWRPDSSPGVFWELGKLLELNYRHKLIVWTDMGYEDLQTIQKARYNVFKRKALEEFQEIFPPYDKYKKFLVSDHKDKWTGTTFISQTPIFKKLSTPQQ